MIDENEASLCLSEACLRVGDIQFPELKFRLNEPESHVDVTEVVADTAWGMC